MTEDDDSEAITDDPETTTIELLSAATELDEAVKPSMLISLSPLIIIARSEEDEGNGWVISVEGGLLGSTADQCDIITVA